MRKVDVIHSAVGASYSSLLSQNGRSNGDGMTITQLRFRDLTVNGEELVVAWKGTPSLDRRGRARTTPHMSTLP